jgi:hypothetical protein
MFITINKAGLPSACSDLAAMASVDQAITGRHMNPKSVTSSEAMLFNRLAVNVMITILGDFLPKNVCLLKQCCDH